MAKLGTLSIMVNHYRLLNEAISEFPVLAIPQQELDRVGGCEQLGMVDMTGTGAMPELGLVADLHNELAVSLYIKAVPGERGKFAQFDFPDKHGEWADRAHEAGCLILLAPESDWLGYGTLADALESSVAGWVPLATRVSSSGVGTRSSDE